MFANACIAGYLEGDLKQLRTLTVEDTDVLITTT
jgi:hypothetical protein